MTAGLIYLLPVPLNPDRQFSWTKEELLAITASKIFIAENVKTMRRFVRAGGSGKAFDDVQFFELDKHNKYLTDDAWIRLVIEGNNAILTSEAGCPCIGDPGSNIVMAAHKAGLKVKPLSAKSSITLALMACGLNAQTYIFHGYLPIDSKGLHAKVKEMQLQIQRFGLTQVFIETPFRNTSMLEKFLSIADDNTMLCIASNLEAENEKIETRAVHYWKKNKPDLHKSPTVFVWGANS